MTPMKTYKVRKFTWLFLIVMLAPLFAGGRTERLATSNRLQVVASTSIIADVVGAIGAEKIQLAILAGPGQNLHAFVPSPQDIILLEKADIVFINGLNLEAGLMPMLEGLSRLISLSDGISLPILAGHGHDDEGHGDEDHGDEEEGHDGEDHGDEGEDHDDEDHGDEEEDHDGEDHGDEEEDHDGEGLVADPHVWFNPSYVMVWAESIGRALASADPSNATFYARNTERYVQKLAKLDEQIRASVNSLPRNRRRLVSDHNFLSYFATEYGFDIIAAIIPSTSDQGQPSPRHIVELAEVLSREELRVIVLGENSGRGLQNLAGILAEEIGENVHIITLLNGSLAKAGFPGDSYLGFMQHNVEMIVGALSEATH